MHRQWLLVFLFFSLSGFGLKLKMVKQVNNIQREQAKSPKVQNRQDREHQTNIQKNHIENSEKLLECQTQKVLLEKNEGNIDLNTLGKANEGQIKLIRVIKKGVKSTMTGSIKQNMTPKILEIDQERPNLKPKIMLSYYA